MGLFKTHRKIPDLRRPQQLGTMETLESAGLIQIYPQPNIRSRPTIDVIAVHGLGGNAHSSWTAADGTNWLHTLLPTSPLFENARIMSFGYDATAFIAPFGQATKGRTFTFAEALLSDLADKRVSAAAKKTPIIFIGHSLGGIVIKAALRHAQALPGQYGNILDSTEAIVFLGTPHQGADAAAWASFLGQVRVLAGFQASPVLDELVRWSNALVELSALFCELATRFQISTFFELRKTNNVLVVPEGSARMSIPNERARGLDADHRTVCKFTENDPNWTIVQTRLEAIATAIEEAEDIAFPEVPTHFPVRTSGGVPNDSHRQRLQGLNHR